MFRIKAFGAAVDNSGGSKSKTSSPAPSLPPRATANTTPSVPQSPVRQQSR